jgi:hypothetical protein
LHQSNQLAEDIIGVPHLVPINPLAFRSDRNTGDAIARPHTNAVRKGIVKHLKLTRLTNIADHSNHPKEGSELLPYSVESK